jgi:UDPglucose 6-dehydrogenase
MKVCVVGIGYVGLVAAACLADGGNHVICVDKDEKKIGRLKKGIIPIYEAQLTEVINRNE